MASTNLQRMASNLEGMASIIFPNCRSVAFFSYCILFSSSANQRVLTGILKKKDFSATWHRQSCKHWPVQASLG